MIPAPRWKTQKSEYSTKALTADGPFFPVIHVVPIYDGLHREHETTGKECWCAPKLEKPDDLAAWLENLEFEWIAARYTDDGPVIVYHQETNGMTAEGIYIETN